MEISQTPGMDIPNAIVQLTSFQTELQNKADAIKLAVDLLTNGYKSDQQAIADGIGGGVAEALKNY